MESKGSNEHTIPPPMNQIIGGNFGRQKQLVLKNLPESATPDKLAQLLTNNNLQFNDCKVQISEDTKRCASGAGSITFNQRNDLSSFVKAMQQLSLDGKQLEITTTQNGDYNTHTSIFVRGLNEQVKETDLIQEFQQFGTILSCMVVIDQMSKRSKGIAFIDYANEESAKLAITKMNGSSLSKYTEKLQVSFYKSLKKGMTDDGEEQKKSTFSSQMYDGSQFKTNLFVKNIPSNIQESHLKELFSKYGQIKSIKIKIPQIWNPNVQQIGPIAATSLAYIDFQREEDASNALNSLQGFNIGTNNLQIAYYQKPQHQVHINTGSDVIDNMNYRVIFLKGLLKYITEDQLLKVCQKYGTVIEVKIKKFIADGQEISKGQAVITYSSKDEAAEALKHLAYHDELGPSLQPDFYITKQGMIKAIEIKNNPLSQYYLKQENQDSIRYGGYGNQGMDMHFQKYMGQQQTYYQQMQQKPRQQNPRNSQQQFQSQRNADHQHHHNQGQRYFGRGGRPTHHQSHHDTNYKNQNQHNQHHQQNQNFQQYQKTAPQFQQLPPPQPNPFAYQMPQPLSQPQFIPSFAPFIIINQADLNSFATEIEKKNYLGNILYEKVEAITQEFAPKITGMLIDRPLTEIFKFCYDKALFEQIVNEAISLLKQNSTNSGSQ